MDIRSRMTDLVVGRVARGQQVSDEGCGTINCHHLLSLRFGNE